MSKYISKNSIAHNITEPIGQCLMISPGKISFSLLILALISSLFSGMANCKRTVSEAILITERGFLLAWANEDGIASKTILVTLALTFVIGLVTNHIKARAPFL